MIEYTNDFIIKLLKQYDMLTKSLRFITDLNQKKDISDQMSKIVKSVLEHTRLIYEERYKKVLERSVYLMDEEKNRLLELINLINERRTYVNNQIVGNKELTGIFVDGGIVLGEDKLEDYKAQVKIIDKYKNNVRMEGILKEEITSLESSIEKANSKINNNKNLNKQLEEKMIRIVDAALTKLSLYDLQDKEKEIDLAYSELGFSLEKAKENAKIARRDYGEEIIVECDNMLSAVMLDYERYKERKLILKLISIFKHPVDTYDELLNKREEINNILVNITNSALYRMVGTELNKEYAAIKLEGQDIAALTSLTEELETKKQLLSEIVVENNSEEFKKLLANLLENEQRYQQKLNEEKKKRELERLERQKIEEKKKLEEIAKRQQALEEERKKEIERRTKELLVEKKNPVLQTPKAEKMVDKEKKETISNNGNVKKEVRPLEKNVERRESIFENNSAPKPNRPQNGITPIDIKKVSSNNDIFSKPLEKPKNDFFSQELKNNKIVDQGIPVIKNNKLDSDVVSAKNTDINDKKVFPDVPLDKKAEIFPSFPSGGKTTSFFDDNEFDELSSYMEDDDKKGWF